MPVEQTELMNRDTVVRFNTNTRRIPSIPEGGSDPSQTSNSQMSQMEYDRLGYARSQLHAIGMLGTITFSKSVVILVVIQNINFLF